MPNRTRGKDRTPIAFDLQLDRRNGAAIAVLEGELDLPAAERAAAPLLEAAREAGALVLDLRPLTFMDSSGLRLVIELHRAGAGGEQEAGYRLEILRGPENVQQVFTLVGLDDVLPFREE